MTRAQLEQAIAFDQSWDDRMGGLPTRVDREYLGYAAGRILEAGVSREQLLAYVTALVDFDDSKGAPS
jgi:hypothetical protein